MKKTAPITEFRLWRHEHLLQVDFACYSLSHHHFARHFHDHYVIELVLQGVDGFYCRGRDLQAAGGQVVLINPGEVHTGNTVNDILLQYFSIYPTPQQLKNIAELLELPIHEQECFPSTLIDKVGLTEQLKLLYTALATGADPLRQEEIFFDCMRALFQLSNNKVSDEVTRRDWRVDRLIEYVRCHFTENISLQQMAGMVNLNPFHVLRLFKKVTGLTPSEYLVILRTEYARKLLRAGHLVQEAAWEAGFYDASHFNRSFRKLAGMNPKFFLSSKGQDRTILSAG